MARKNEPVKLDKVLPRINAHIATGLTNRQVQERLENGYANAKPYSAERTVSQILKENIFTYLNLVLMVLAICTIFFGTFWNITFLGVVIINTIIGILQELRSKRTLSKLHFVTAPNASVIRDGKRLTIPTEQAVLDDIAIFSGDQQIYADAIVLGGECSVNEALVTGESDEIVKKTGDTLLSGSFVVTGECIARLDKVGRDSFVAQLTLEAKKTKGKATVGMVPTLKRFIKVVGIIIVPVGISMFVRQLLVAVANPPAIQSLSDLSAYSASEAMRAATDAASGVVDIITHSTMDAVRDATDATVGALVAMLPDGLYLLVSIALTVSVMRLAKKRTLIQERGCVETLARVNVLCVDKTGTITESNMNVKDIVLLNKERFSADNITSILTDYAGNMSGENATMEAIQAYINAPTTRRAMKIMPFSSAKKYGGITFSNDESYLLGAPERILQTKYDRYKGTVEAHSAMGYRVVLLARYNGKIDEQLNLNGLTPLALILLSNNVRKEAPATFGFFAKQGVKIIVISGDNPMTVSQIAHEAGIEGAERYIDAAELTTDRKLKRAVKEYIVFGRVTPDQKRRLVRALKAAGNVVAMTGDGVNDVLALKDANCSIAMASGSEVASQVADIVLLDSDFSAMPSVVMEGRRVINNIERSASFYFSKNLFSLLFVLAVTIPTGRLFPLQALQFTLFNVLLIGLPSFVLALQPNKNLVKGKFLPNVFRNALPAGLTTFLGLTGMNLLARHFDIPSSDTATLSLLVISFVGFLMLYRLCLPLNALRKALIITVFVAFTVGLIIFITLGFLPPITEGIWLLIGTCVCTVPVYLGLVLLFRKK